MKNLSCWLWGAVGAAVIVVAVLPVIGRRHTHGIDPTQSMIMSLAGSLERYRVDFDSYPPGSASGTADDGTLVESLNGADNRGVIANKGAPNERRYEPYLTLDKKWLKSENGRHIVIDQWGMPIHYFNSKAFVEGGGNPKFVHNPASVDLYSTGQNRVKDSGLIEPGTGEVKQKGEILLVDDITNF